MPSPRFKLRVNFSISMLNDNGSDQYGGLYFGGSDSITVSNLRDASDAIEAIIKRMGDFDVES